MANKLKGVHPDIVIMRMENLLLEIHNEIQIAIYNDDGMDGGRGQELLDDIEAMVEVEKSHRDVDGIPES